MQHHMNDQVIRDYMNTCKQYGRHGVETYLRGGYILLSNPTKKTITDLQSFCNEATMLEIADYIDSKIAYNRQYGGSPVPTGNAVASTSGTLPKPPSNVKKIGNWIAQDPAAAGQVATNVFTGFADAIGNTIAKIRNSGKQNSAIPVVSPPSSEGPVGLSDIATTESDTCDTLAKKQKDVKNAQANIKREQAARKCPIVA